MSSQFTLSIHLYFELSLSFFLSHDPCIVNATAFVTVATMGDTGTMTSGAVVVSRKPLSSDGLKETRAPSNDPNIRTLGIYQASNVMLPKRLVFTRHRANKANKTDKAGRTTKDEAPAFQNFAGLKYKAGVSQDKFEDEFSCVGVLMDVVNIRDGTSVPTGVTIQAAGLTSVISNTLTPIQVDDQLR